MAVDAGRYAGRRRRNDPRAAKEKRQKVILVAGAGLLLVVLVIQLPKTLHRLHGSSSVTTPATVVPSSAPTGATATEFRGRLAALRAYKAKDPFTQQVVQAGTVPQAAQPARGPAVRTTHLVVKDPFEQQVSVTGATTGGTTSSSVSPGSASRPSSTVGGGVAMHGKYIVVLASVPLPDGLAEAQRIARLARARGITSASVLTSSRYRSLRPGFYVVYGGGYESLRSALGGLTKAHGHGFLTAYTRTLGA
jgi:hypothetical protein